MSPQSPVQPLPTRRRKVSIEIYFVLYLSAIILLLGTTPSTHNSREDQLEEVIRHLLVSDFKVKVEKAALLYSFVPAGVTLDTSGAILRRDSLNVITAKGTFSHVDFKVISIEDSANSQPVPVERARLLMTGERSAIFQWAPSPNDRNGVYRVTIAGIATPLPPASLSGELRDKVAEILRRKGTVSDSVTFTINIFAVMDQAMLRRATQAPRSGNPFDTGVGGSRRVDTLFTSSTLGSAFNGPGFELAVGNADLPVPSGGAWRNRITLSGSTPMSDLDLSITEGKASIVEKTATSLVMAGTAPVSGRQQVTVVGKRRSDGRTVSASFTIRGVPVAPLSVPGAMLLGQTYALNFVTGGLPSERIAVEVVENGKVVISKDESRSAINYQPQTAGKVRFIRYLDDQKLDDAESDIVPIPVPVAKIQPADRGASETMVTTITYGSINRLPNKSVLKIKEGNAEEPEPVDEKFNDATKQMIQTWRVRRKDHAQEFSFKAYAIDQRGSKSGKSSEVSFSVR